MTTNLRADGNGKFDWTFDLDRHRGDVRVVRSVRFVANGRDAARGIELGFRTSRTVGVRVDARGRGAHIAGTGANVHLLRNSAHWVHIDNPNGLLDILAPSFENMERNSKAR